MYFGKYKDILLDGRWTVDSVVDNGKYLLKNIYNGDTTKLSQAQIENVINGKDSVAKIRCRRFGGHAFDIRNSVTIGWGRLKHRFATK